MAKFLFLTDTHIGASPIGFHQQPAYPEHMEQLIQEIKKLAEQGEIDFVLHGGDMVDKCTEETLKEAARLFDLPVPVYLSLGNHDLDCEDALDKWLRITPQFFIGNKPQYTIDGGDCFIHVVPNQWEPGYSYYWKSAQDVFFEEDQLLQLDSALEKYRHQPQLLSIHNPIYGVPMEQSGKDQIIHGVSDEFSKLVLGRLSRFPSIKGVLSGHNHINTLKQTEQGVFVTGSAFSETPFEYKIVELTQHSLSVETRTLSIPVSFEPVYNEEKSYVQGQEQHRACTWRF
ncbi:metallophosphoesterase family protein [Paenibacillus sp. IITD108]|uniref:metallophosphoesterase family protein n=1 Tax=Paenibacillus sp. IITD108 TaxID=3116649 RepID=UPI002F407B6E